MLKPYQKANELKRSYDNHNAWLHGMYVLDALQTALSGFNGKKSKMVKYPKEPYPITQIEAEEYEKKKMLRMKAQFGAFAEGLEVKSNVGHNQDSN